MLPRKGALQWLARTIYNVAAIVEDHPLVVVVSFVIATDPTRFHFLSHFKITQLHFGDVPRRHFALTGREYDNCVFPNVQCHIFFGPGLIVFFGDVIYVF